MGKKKQKSGGKNNVFSVTGSKVAKSKIKSKQKNKGKSNSETAKMKVEQVNEMFTHMRKSSSASGSILPKHITPPQVKKDKTIKAQNQAPQVDVDAELEKFSKL